MIWVEGPEKGQGQGDGNGHRKGRQRRCLHAVHFGGHYQGEDRRSKYPEGADPYVLGESANTAMTYGYDSVTNMQETKCTLCKVSKA